MASATSSPIVGQQSIPQAVAPSRPGKIFHMLVQSRPLAWAVFTVLYLIPTVYLARLKLFWDDEFFTLYLSQTPSWHDLLRALATGADQHPPSFYYLTHLVTTVFG